MTIKELIAALEKAEGGQENRLVGQAVELARIEGWLDDDAYKRACRCLAAGASIDAALTLVPAEREVCLYTYTEPRAGGRVCLYIRDDFRCGDEGRHPSSLAIAICIAALKARGVGDG